MDKPQEQHALNVDYLKENGWTRLSDRTWLPTELLETNAKPYTFEMAMNMQSNLDGEPRDMACLQGALE